MKLLFKIFLSQGKIIVFHPFYALPIHKKKNGMA